MAVKGEPNSPLDPYFHKSAAAVLRVFDHVEAEYVKPGYRTLDRSVRARPVFSTFALAFALLSALPVLAFIGASLFVLSSTLFLALGAALAASAALIVIFTALLFSTLLPLAAFSVLLTLFILGTYFAGRLALTLATARQSGASPRDALATWAREARTIVLPARDIIDTSEIMSEDKAQAGDANSSPIVTKPDGTQDGPATAARHAELNEQHAARLEPSSKAERASNGGERLVVKEDGTVDPLGTSPKLQME